MKKTPIYEKHCELGGKIIDFGGWALPVQYKGIIEEHNQVRKAAGLFDVSHMGEIIVKGQDAETIIQRLVTNNIIGAGEYRIIYSPMCYPDGGVVDDLLIYKYSEKYYLLIVNAGNTEKDYNWIRENAKGRAEIINVSDSYAQLALQGPGAEAILQKLTDTPLSDIGFFRFMPDVSISGVKAIVSRTGYTGEDGFEIYINSESAVYLWESILEAGREDGLVPVGLGARDTLRFEAALPLYGHEISQDTSPLEAGLSRFVKLDKDDFIGKEALVRQQEQGLKRVLTGFEMVDRGIPRSGYEVQVYGRKVGSVTSGSFSPTLGKNLGMALVESGIDSEDAEIDIIIRNRALRAKTVKLPFYKKKYKK
ncbi:MAG: glycine cleavage system aminomethyltransferase GcvT [Clostridiaceae bacterium]|nr:glycine cleavage system aminomethyltransferase GcvT [Clostridiaceae bacterium]